MSLHSTIRQQTLAGYLKINHITAYNESLKLQKFLFFYEAFSKADNDDADFSHLKGYKRGPVFSNVWGDYTKERSEFDESILLNFKDNQALINENRAKKVSFLVDTLTSEELSELSHMYNIWNCKRKEIMAEYYQVKLEEEDFNTKDIEISKSLESMCPDYIVDDYIVIPMKNKNFVLSKHDYKRLEASHMDALYTLSDNNDLHNPVYIDIDIKGRLVVD